jgi:GH15 family glucan-1,4-alpha-glucosidase
MQWLQARDELYEEIMKKAWNPELQFFGQSYEETDVLDSSLLIMPLVFFSTPVRSLYSYQVYPILITVSLTQGSFRR